MTSQLPRRWLLALLLGLACASVDAANPATVSDWLTRAGQALREANYQGKVVYLSGERTESLQMSHRFAEGIEEEHWQALTGPPREVLRDASGLRRGAGDVSKQAYAFTRGKAWVPVLAGVDGLPFYRCGMAGRAMVAGRRTQIVDIAARDDWRYGFRLWLDVESALPLRVAVLDPAGAIVEQLAFSEVSIERLPVDSHASPSPPSNTASAAAAATPAWRVASLPPGFVLRRSRQDAAGLQMLYSDGLASLSVYIEPMSRDAAGESATRQGAIHARGFWRDGWRVVAVGKVPAATVERVARTVRAAEPLR